MSREAESEALWESMNPRDTEHMCSGCHHRWTGELTGAVLCGDCWRKGQGVIQGSVCPDHICAICYHPKDLCSHCDRAPELRATFTNEVIRAIGALARQQNVCREQDGKMVFVTGMEAAREYIVEHVQLARQKALAPTDAENDR